MGEKRGQEVPYAEAVASWYDTVYLPMVQLIRERNLLRDFPNRTETDMYLWIMDHRASLSDGQMGWEVRPELAAADLVERYSPTPKRSLPRLARKIANLLIPESLESGPPPGLWRSEHTFTQTAPHRGDHMFDDLLVTVPGGDDTWPAVRLAIEVARREEARLTGLMVVKNEADREAEAVQAVRQEFARLSAEAGIASRLLVEVGSEISTLVCQRAHWVDLVVFRMNFPPPTRPLERLRSGSRLIIRRCSAPIFAVPDAPFRLDSALLAYGPGRKADEALYVATYLAGSWQIPLTVVTVKSKDTGEANSAASGLVSQPSPTPLERARQYIEAHGVTANYIEESGETSQDAGRAILLTAEARGADFLVMGGYESGPLRESLRGSTVDRVLRSTRRPVLICR
jgi:nucleotide-binding universal stress UspA family protein